ncbi:MAG: L,D-transpeptidase [Hyphomicrobiales bacterium]|nr:L,D-transpeptidase [Hyphomicrobiales bacterium]
MRHISFSTFACATLLVVPSAAFAAGAEPTVVRGIYAANEARVIYARREQVAVAPDLGGGFIEMLVKGSGDRGARYNQPLPAPVQQVAPQYAALPQYAPAVQQIAPSPPRAALGRAIDPVFQRQEVDYTGPQRAGAIVVDTPSKFLYLVLGNGRALRYGIGVGRPGFEWAGVKTISRKAEWPDWRPPSEMLKRRPDLPTFMAGGPQNPLGARALYLGSSLYRIHGTNEPHTIGQNVSSGCIRMMNEDVTDLYTRVKVGTQVTVI